MSLQQALKILFVFSNSLIGLIVSSNLIKHKISLFSAQPLIDTVLGWVLFGIFAILLITSFYEE